MSVELAFSQQTVCVKLRCVNFG